MTYAQVNGVDLYYDTHGQGRPLILLHGGLGSADMFGVNVDALAAAGHQVNFFNMNCNIPPRNAAA